MTRTTYSKAQLAWAELPDWVEVLADAVDKAGATRPVAETIGYSPSAVSSVINNSYTGRLVHLETAVRRSLMRDRVECPVLGTITGERCERAQRVKRCPSTNPVAVRLFRTCRSGECAFSRAAGGIAP